MRHLINFILNIFKKHKRKTRVMITKIALLYNAVPQIIVEQNGIITVSGTGKNEIDFNELYKFIELLEQQQDAINEYVAVSKGTYTIRNTSHPAILWVPSAQDTNPKTGSLSIQLNGVAVGAPEDLEANYFCTVTGLSTLDYINAPCVFAVTIPRKSDDFERDYTISATLPAGSFVTTRAEAVGGGWLVYTTVIPSFIGGVMSGTINFVVNDLLKLTVGTVNASVIGICSNQADTKARLVENGSLEETYLDRDTDYSFSLPVSVYGAYSISFTCQKKKNGVNVGAPIAFVNNAWNPIAIPNDGTVDQLHFTMS